MLGTMIGLVVCIGIYGPLNFQSHDYIPWALLLWPQVLALYSLPHLYLLFAPNYILHFSSPTCVGSTS